MGLFCQSSLFCLVHLTCCKIYGVEVDSGRGYAVRRENSACIYFTLLKECAEIHRAVLEKNQREEEKRKKKAEREKARLDLEFAPKLNAM